MDESLRTFARALAGRRPVPGGGAAADYLGALGAALAGMAIAYSVKEPSEMDDETRPLIEGSSRMEALREELLDLVEKDCEAYGAFSQALKLPKKTAEEKALRKSRIRSSLEQSLSVPLEAASLCLEGLRRLGGLAGRINPRLITDAGVSARCFNAAFHSSWYNVMVNANALKDGERCRELAAKREGMNREIKELEAEILAKVEQSLAGS